MIEKTDYVAARRCRRLTKPHGDSVLGNEKSGFVEIGVPHNCKMGESFLGCSERFRRIHLQVIQVRQGRQGPDASAGR
jgi:hypothetical protein